jgi:hypothetical protein
MRKKFVGIFVLMLLIVTTLSATGTTNVQTNKYVKENNYLETYQNTPANSPGIINIKITAKVVYFEDPYNLLGGAIQINDIITGKYIYDSGVQDDNPDPQTGQYWFNSSTYGIEFKAGGFVFKTNPSNPCLCIAISNYHSSDGYYLASPNNLQLSNGLLVGPIEMRLQEYTGNALSSDALPTTAPVLSDWENKYIITVGYNPSSYEYFALGANITKFTLSRSKTRDVYYNSQPILTWLFERFPKLSPLFKYISRFQ